MVEEVVAMGVLMPRGYIVTQKQINEAHRLRKLGKTLKEISKLVKFSKNTVANMLKKPRNPYV
jgi:lambda repressor-like predicted transcriptional regulator